MSTIYSFPVDRSMANVLLREDQEDEEEEEEDEDEKTDDEEEDEDEEDGNGYLVNAVVLSHSTQRLFA